MHLDAVILRFMLPVGLSRGLCLHALPACMDVGGGPVTDTQAQARCDSFSIGLCKIKYFALLEYLKILNVLGRH